MSMKQLLVAWTFLALLISGCAAEPESGPAAQRDPGAPAAAFGAGDGAIAGTVLEESFLPVPNATVDLAPLKGDAFAQTLTDLSGKFSFSNLPPSDYRVTARGEGFANRTVIVRVAVEEIATVSVILSETPSAEPYVLTASKNSMQTCAHILIVVSFQDACNPVYYGDNRGISVNASAGHRATLVEFEWKDRQVAAGWYLIVHVKGDNPSVGRLADSGRGDNVHPVVRLEMRPGGYYLNATGNAARTVTPHPFPDSEDAFMLTGRAYYLGQHRDVFRPYNPQCDNGGYCGGVGFVPEWRYSIHVSVFMNDAPPTLAAYSALPDG